MTDLRPEESTSTIRAMRRELATRNADIRKLEQTVAELTRALGEMARQFEHVRARAEQQVTA